MNKPIQVETERLICPNHPQNPGDQLFYMVETSDDDSLVICPRCDYACQNFLKYPTAEIYNRSSREFYIKNMLTGEIIEKSRRSEE